MEGTKDIFGRTVYDLVENSCIDYAGQHLASAKLADPDFDGNPVNAPYYQYDDFLSQLEKHAQGWVLTERDGKREFRWLNVPNMQEGWLDNGHECLAPWVRVNPKHGEKINRDGKYHVYDPITLDLNGDGIQTIAAAGFSGSLFDHNNDGIRTATGWVNAEDGLLVRDLNGNGIIDNGGELFGDNTALADGSKAAHGFVALAQLDSNNDGKVDALDSAFNELKVWIDANSDGISQASELRTLMDLDIQSLDVAYKDVNQNLGNGNAIRQLGSYTKTDGSTAQMGDAWFAADKLYSRFTDKIDMTAEQSQAANLSGIGRLRDLNQAAAISGDLANVLKAYSQAQTKQEQLALLDSLVHEWAETDSEWGKKAITFDTTFTKTANEGIALTPSQAKKLQENALIYLSDEAQAAIDAARDRIAVLDAFTGQDSSKLYYMSEEDALNIIKITNQTYDNLATNIYQSLLLQTRLQPYMNEIAFKIEDNQFVLDFAGVQAAFNQVYENNPEKALVDLAELLAFAPSEAMHNELRPLLHHYLGNAYQNNTLNSMVDLIGKAASDKLNIQLATQDKANLSDGSKDGILIGDKQDNTLNADNGDDILIGGSGNDKLNGGYGSDTYVFSKGHGVDVIADYDGGDAANDTIRFTNVNFADLTFRRDNSNLILVNGDDAITISSFFSGSSYQIETFEFADKTVSIEDLMRDGLVLDGLDANETINGWEGRNVLNGHGGNDTLNANSKDDVLDGGAGDDTLNANSGDDVLIGGLGNDKLNGGYGSDTYVFSKGHGVDVIADYDGGDAANDTIRFTNVNFADLTFRRDNSNLILVNGDDAITISSFFSGSSYQIETFEFADKTVSIEDLMRDGLVLDGLNTNETINGWSGRNVLNGHGGNDTLNANSKNDVLDGGAGDDTLNANSGDDVLIGGLGNDKLNGGYGSDTYVFSKGHGVDVIADYDGGDAANDTIRFTNVNFADLTFRRDNSNLILVNGDDAITISSFFSGSSYQIETFEFADKTVSIEDLMRDGLVLDGLDANETINGWEGRNVLNGHGGNDTLNANSKDDVLDGGAGDDTLNANSGDDVLIGGLGNDKLNGGYGSDTYVFSKGHGVDVIADYDGGDAANDKLILNDVALGEVSFSRQNSDLLISGYAGEDSITIQSFFSGSHSRIEQFVFADKTLNNADFAAVLKNSGSMVQAMAAFGSSESVTVTDWNSDALKNIPAMLAVAA
ncbi:calcium-binding protein [Neisseriaceae bacterium B1]